MNCVTTWDLLDLIKSWKWLGLHYVIVVVAFKRFHLKGKERKSLFWRKMCHSHALSLQSQCHWQPWGETIMNKPLRTNVALNESLSPPTSCFIPRLLLRFIINGDVQAWENLARHWERKFSREFPRYLYIDVVLFTPENLIFLIFHSLSRRCISAHVALLETKSQGFLFNPYRTENFTSFFRVPWRLVSSSCTLTVTVNELSMKIPNK